MNSCSLFILEYLRVIGHEEFECLVLYCNFQIFFKICEDS